MINPGDFAHLKGVKYGQTKLLLRICEFSATEWMCEQPIRKTSEMPELSTWRFFVSDSFDSVKRHAVKLDLGVNCSESAGTQILTLYAPFWMINKTGKLLTYKGQDPKNIVYHFVDFEGVPLMFSHTSSSKGFFSGKRKASLRIEESSWSESFTLDAIEDAGKVTCKRPCDTKKEPYQIGLPSTCQNPALQKLSLLLHIT